MQIRLAEQRDAQAIAKVHVDAWRTTYEGIIQNNYLNQLSYESMTSLWKYNIKTDQVYVAVNDQEEIIGFTTGGVKKTEGYHDFQGELYAVYILKEFQGMNIGRKLLNMVVEHVKTLQMNSMLVLVLKDNPAVQFYKAMGAQKIDSLTISVAGTTLQEEVYGWLNLNNIHK
ncbi:GNAT family N-acetyltransferase [Oceanobacillus manasiensis]|uniref:GNAT family N-acetyltransferase n=1 Tax=Oceanobacillus manasiensis TaxID=586413 RepID=UPI0005AADE11|nr:GNAT family N-acetyltransferase [Oceanobacillus manasiensis]